MAIACFESLYEAYAPMVYWAVFGMVNNHDTALELTQLVFLKAYEHWDTLRRLQEAQAKSWLYRSARNATIDRIRKEKRELVVDALPEQADANEAGQPEAATLRRDGQDRLYTLVQSLPALYREPILLHYFAQLSQKEAAAVLGMHGGTYRSRLARGRAMLEELLREEGHGNAE